MFSSLRTFGNSSAGEYLKPLTHGKSRSLRWLKTLASIVGPNGYPGAQPSPGPGPQANAPFQGPGPRPEPLDPAPGRRSPGQGPPGPGARPGPRPRAPGQGPSPWAPGRPRAGSWPRPRATAPEALGLGSAARAPRPGPRARAPGPRPRINRRRSQDDRKLSRHFYQWSVDVLSSKGILGPTAILAYYRQWHSNGARAEDAIPAPWIEADAAKTLPRKRSIHHRASECAFGAPTCAGVQ